MWAQYRLVRPKKLGLILAIHNTATQLDTNTDLTLILNRGTAYSQKFSLTV